MNKIKANAKVSPIFKILVSVASLLFIPTALAQNASLLPNAVQQFFDDNGNPLSSGTVTFYVPNTTTKKAIYKDAAKSIPWSNPITLNAAGRPPGDYGIYGDGNYDQLLKKSNGNTVWNRPTSSTGTSGGGGVSFSDGMPVGTVMSWSGITAPNKWAFAYGQELSRTTYSDLYNQITVSLSVTCTSADPTLTSVADTTQLRIGAVIEASCVTPGSTIISKTSNTVTLSANAVVSTTTTGVFFNFGNGNGSTTFNAPDLRGRVIAGRDNMGGTAASRLTSTYFAAPGTGAVGGSQSHTMTLAELVAHSHTITDPGHNHSYTTHTALTAATAAGTPTNSGEGTGTTGTNTTGITIDSTGSTAPFTIVQPTMTLNYIIKVLPPDFLYGDVPPPSSTILGGVFASNAPPDQYAIGIDTLGNVIYSALPNMAATTIKMNPTNASQPQADYTIQGLTNVASCDVNLDYIPIYQASTGTIKNITCGQIVSGGVAGVASWGGLTGIVGLASGGGLAVSGSNATTTYSQSGTATARTIPNRLQDTISLADFGGGTANDTTAVQAAFDACTTAGGCTMVCRSGVTYTVDNVNIGSNVKLQGACKFQQRTNSSSILTATSKSNILIDGVTFAATTPTVNTAPLIQITTSNIVRIINSYFTGSATVDTGLASPTSGANAIQVDALAGGVSTNVQVSGNHFYRFNFVPVRMYSTENFKVEGNIFQSNAFGVYMTGVKRFTVGDNVFDTCVMYATSPSTSQFCIAIAFESTDGHSLGVSSRGIVSGNTIIKYGYAQGILVHAGSFIAINGTNCEDTGICISLNPAGGIAADVISNVSVNGVQTNGATSLSTFPSSADIPIVVQSGPAPNVNITNVVVKGVVASNGNRVAQDTNSGCMSLGYADYVNISGNTFTSCQGSGIVVSSPVVGISNSVNVFDNILTASGNNNGIYYLTGASGAQVNQIGNHFKNMTNGKKYATGISIANIQDANTLCIGVTNCTTGP